MDLRTALIRDPLVVSPGSTVLAAVVQMGQVGRCCDLAEQGQGLSGLPQLTPSSCVVVDGDRRVVGIITERDVVKLGAQQQPLETLLVEQVMTKPVITMGQSELTDLFSVVGLLQQHHIRHLPIVDEHNRLVGLLTHDSLRQVTRPIDLLRLRSVSEVMSRDVVCAAPDDTLLQVAQTMAHNRVSSVVITLPQNVGLTVQPVGIVTERDMVQFQALGLDLAAHRAKDMMSTPVFTVGLEESLWAVQQIMGQHWIRRVAVVGDRGELLGIVTQSSLLQALNPLELYNLAAVLEDKMAQLEMERNQLAAIIGFSQDAIISLDLTGTITSWNPAATQVYGYAAEAMLGKSVMRLIPPDLRAEADQILQRLQAGETIPPYETQRLHQDGHRIEVALTLSPLYNRDGLLVGASKIVRDISARKRHEAEHQQAKQALKAKTEEIDTFFSVALDLLCIADTQGYFRRLNQGWTKTLGYAITELEGTRFLDYIHPEDRADTEAQVVRLSNQEVVTGFINRMRCVDGTYRWVEWQSVPVGNLIYAAARDITDRRSAEMRLRASEARYRNVIETTLEGVWILDGQGKTTFVNQRMADMLGYAPAEMEGQAFTDFMAAVDQAQAQAYLAQRQQGIADQHPFKFKCRDGRPLWAIVSATVMKDEGGQFIGCVGLLTDITQLVQTQEALRASELRLSSVLDSSLDGIMAFRAVRDDQGQIVDFEYTISNPVACQVMGRSQTDLIGQRMLEIMPGHRDEGLFDSYVQVVETGQPSHREFYYNHDGLESWFEHVAVKLEDGFAVTFRDITNLKRSEQALQQANQELEARIADLNQRHAEQVLLSDLSEFLQVCLTVEEACAALGGLVAPLFPHCSGGLFLNQDHQETMHCVAQWGDHEFSLEQFPARSCWALRWGHAHLWSPAQPGLICAHVRQAHAPEDSPHLPVVHIPNQGLCVPLIAQGETLGILSLATDADSTLLEAKQHLARTVAEQIALALANLNLRATLHLQSIRDSLTGLFNRRYLEESLAQEMARALRHHRPLSVIMLDIDHFKRFNDTYGHEAGDYVLKTVSETLQSSVRSSDVVCRYGGEELTILLPDLALTLAKAKAERLRSSIENLCLVFKGKGLGPITASLGVASFPEHGTDGTTLVQTADAALYQAKAAGRNRVIVAS
ncbi:PleD-like protein [Leptolyngbya sp. BL0902]|nr:PleD-like protein [Leptolyngbya sp. BL0902]